MQTVVLVSVRYGFAGLMSGHGVRTGDKNVTHHPPGIPGITHHGHITNIVTSYHHLKRNAAKREEGREWAYMVRPPFLLLLLLFLTTQL